MLYPQKKGLFLLLFFHHRLNVKFESKFNVSIMKKLIISTGVPLLLCSTALWAQEKIPSTWTLQDCFEYARDHSITLQQNRLSVEESEVNTKEAKAQLFPSFDFSNSHKNNNYPMADGSRSGKND